MSRVLHSAASSGRMYRSELADVGAGCVSESACISDFCMTLDDVSAAICIVIKSA